MVVWDNYSSMLAVASMLLVLSDCNSFNLSCREGLKLSFSISMYPIIEQ